MGQGKEQATEETWGVEKQGEGEEGAGRQGAERNRGAVRRLARSPAHLSRAAPCAMQCPWARRPRSPAASAGRGRTQTRRDSRAGSAGETPRTAPTPSSGAPTRWRRVCARLGGPVTQGDHAPAARRAWCGGRRRARRSRCRWRPAARGTCSASGSRPARPPPP